MAHTGIFRPLARVGQRLYVRIWLAVVLAVAVLTLLLGWAWRMAAEPPLQEIVVRNAAGELIGTAEAQSHHNPGARGDPERGVPAWPAPRPFDDAAASPSGRND